MTTISLKSHTVRDLAAMAKKKKVAGWHMMRKDELIRALVKQAGGRAAKQNGSSGRHDKKPRSPRLLRQLDQIKAQLADAKDLAAHSLDGANGRSRDRLVVMVRDPYWLHAYWELSRRGIDRARAAMGQHWHEARPVLRLHEVSRNGSTSTSRKLVRDIEVHGGVSNWYIDVQDPPKSYQIEIGYLASGNRFYCLARSNVVSTPQGGAADSFDKNWAEVAKDFDRIYAMSGGYVEQEGNGELKEVFEEQLRRPVGEPLTSRFGRGADCFAPRRGELNFHVETELIVHGVAHPNARVTLRGEPVHLRPDGTFAVRFTLPDRRHVLPLVASTCDGVEQRTIVLAVDRNTKVMEPVIRDPAD